MKGQAFEKRRTLRHLLREEAVSTAIIFCNRKTAVRELNKSAEARKKLIDRNPSFARCKQFEARVDCYRLCPEIDADTNEMRSTYASWRTSCR